MECKTTYKHKLYNTIQNHIEQYKREWMKKRQRKERGIDVGKEDKYWEYSFSTFQIQAGRRLIIFWSQDGQSAEPGLNNPNQSWTTLYEFPCFYRFANQWQVSGASVSNSHDLITLRLWLMVNWVSKFWFLKFWQSLNSTSLNPLQNKSGIRKQQWMSSEWIRKDSSKHKLVFQITKK